MNIKIPNPFKRFDRPDTYKYSLQFPIINPYVPPKKTAFWYQNDRFKKNLDRAQKIIVRAQKLVDNIDEVIEKVSDKVTDTFCKSISSLSISNQKTIQDMVRKQTRFMELQRTAMFYGQKIEWAEFTEWLKTTKYSFSDGIDHMNELFLSGKYN